MRVVLYKGILIVMLQHLGCNVQIKYTLISILQSLWFLVILVTEHTGLQAQYYKVYKSPPEDLRRVLRVNLLPMVSVWKPSLISASWSRILRPSNTNAGFFITSCIFLKSQSCKHKVFYRFVNSPLKKNVHLFTRKKLKLRITARQCI